MEHETRNIEHGTRDMEHRTLDTAHSTRTTDLGTWNAEHGTRNMAGKWLCCSREPAAEHETEESQELGHRYISRLSLTPGASNNC